jgi:thiosulfate/3-mercaptopyruvate sulfurtransferase
MRDGRYRLGEIMAVESPLKSTGWLDTYRAEPHVKILDASWYLPGMGRDAYREFENKHIPGAVFFDIDGIAQPDTDLPHMAADPQRFAELVGALGISADDTIVVYDGAGLFSAARAWWNLRAMGAARTYVLDGGLPKWLAEGRQVEFGTGVADPVPFAPHPRQDALVSAEQVQRRREFVQVVDMRPADRFTGDAPEPRAGLRSGHIPGSLNVPFGDLVKAGRLRPKEELAARIASAGVDAQQPVIASCGSGVTAPILLLALAQMGIDAMTLYDGSWAEWGANDALPLERGPA